MPNIDSNRMPQQVHINWMRILKTDDTSDKPDERDEGFWPSRRKSAAGYVDPENFDAEMAKAKARMQAWEDGDWYYVGVIARATIHIPIGGNSFRIMEVESSGLWGIESDAGEYLNEVYAEEKAELMHQLKTLGDGIANAIQKG